MFPINLNWNSLVTEFKKKQTDNFGFMFLIRLVMGWQTDIVLC